MNEVLNYIWIYSVHFNHPLAITKSVLSMANSVDPDETPHYAASHLGLNCHLHRWGRGSVYKCLVFVCLFDLILYIPVNIFSVMPVQVFLGWTSTKQGLYIMCIAQGHNAVTPVRLKLTTPRSRVKHATTEPLRSHKWLVHNAQVVSLETCVSTPLNVCLFRTLIRDSENQTDHCYYQSAHTE